MSLDGNQHGHHERESDGARVTAHGLATTVAVAGTPERWFRYGSGSRLCAGEPAPPLGWGGMPHPRPLVHEQETTIPEFDFVVDGSAVAGSLLRVLLITLTSFVAYFVVKKVTRKAVQSRIPLVKEESRQRLTARATTIIGALNQVIKVALTALTLLVILAEVGIETAPMLAAVGVVGLALGFAAQGIVRDYLHGVYILIEDWYRIGDWVKIDGDEGTVEEVSLRRTVLRNMDGTLMIRPNSSVITASNMTNERSKRFITTSPTPSHHHPTVQASVPVQD